jgi:thiosulfate reductase/polysulfide reductase chain A
VCPTARQYPRQGYGSYVLCAKKAAGITFQYDDERPQTPLKSAAALAARASDAAQLGQGSELHGRQPQGCLRRVRRLGRSTLRLRWALHRSVTKSFRKAIGSPTKLLQNNDCTCVRNVYHATRTILGVGRKGFNYDIKNTRHIVSLSPQPNRVPARQGSQGVHLGPRCRGQMYLYRPL